MDEQTRGYRRRKLFNRRLRVTLLGRRLLSRNIIDERTLRRALRTSRSVGKPLGQVLLDEGSVSESQLRDALLWQRRQRARCERKMLRAVESDALQDLNALAHQDKKATGPPPSVSREFTRVGELLRKAGLVTADCIRHALERQKETGKKLGRLLVEAGEISGHALRAALQVQRRLRKLAIAAGVCTVLAAFPACNSYDYTGLRVQSTPWDARWERVERALEKAHDMQYRRDAGIDEWQSPGETALRGGGDCEDLSIWLYDKMVENGVKGARICVGKKNPRDTQFHSWVMWLAGEKTYILDPTVSGSISNARLCPAGFYKPYYSYDMDGKYVHHRLSEASYSTGL